MAGRATARHRRRLERAHGERHQVGGERRRALEVHRLAAVGKGLDLSRRLVREHGVPLARGDGDGEARLHGRLVEAGEEAPRVGRLELGEGVAVLAGARGVQAAQVAAQLAPERELEGRLAGGKRLGQHDAQGLAIGVGLDAAPHAPAVHVHHGPRHAQIGGVDPQIPPAAGELDVVGDLSAERRAGSGVDVHVHIHVRGAHVRGQAISLDLGGACLGFASRGLSLLRALLHGLLRALLPDGLRALLPLRQESLLAVANGAVG